MTIQKGFGFPEYSYQGASLPERQRGVPAAVPGLPAERCMPLNTACMFASVKLDKPTSFARLKKTDSESGRIPWRS